MSEQCWVLPNLARLEPGTKQLQRTGQEPDQSKDKFGKFLIVICLFLFW